ncbi:ribosomal protection-like ABC-F family protein [Macrococcus animalis]|uniref:ribosomal protection-like ABC-F family protein n=1 Tax=Macrococcus animalis TaxID=3395467 RepID=UPI0039BE4B4B
MRLNKTDIYAGEKRLFKDLHFEIEAGEHVALLGNNGIGKTTVLSILVQQDDEIGVLEQQITAKNITVLDYIMQGKPGLYQLKMKLNDDMNAMNSYLDQDGYTFESEIITMMHKFNLSESDAERDVQSLSGGEQTKVSLIRLILSGKTKFIFDEPTNHIDAETKQWLVNWMASNDYTILYASHDRTFINQTAHYILELTREGLRKFHMKYDQYKTQIDLEIKTNQALVEKERKEKKRMKQMIQEMREWHHEMNHKASVRDFSEQKKLAKMAKRMKARESRLNHEMANFEGKIEKAVRTEYDIETSEINHKYILQCMDVSHTFQNTLFERVRFSLEQGEVVQIDGKNGSGKSTLLKLIIGELPLQQGEISMPPTLEIGYFSQKLENLNPNHTVLEEITSLDISETEVRTILAAFRFDASRMDDLVQNLSMGEKCRLSFVKLYFSKAHLLVLDEPTNYFDIEMQDIIGNLLKQYKGTVLFVSHDEYFSEMIKTRTLTLTDKTLLDSKVMIEKSVDTNELSKLLHRIDDLEQQ